MLSEPRHYFLVGDVHAVKAELDDCQRLVDLISESVRPTDHLVFLGDLYDNHAVIDLAVQKFWTESLSRLDKLVAHIYILAGNHDMHKSSKMKGSAVSLHVGPKRTVVDGWNLSSLSDADADALFLPFFHKEQDYTNTVINAGYPEGGLLFCHNTFQGAKYENGFYAPDGFRIDPDKPYDIISGHIHTTQSISPPERGRGTVVWYPGAPRWFTKSDANEKKAIYRIEVGPLVRSDIRHYKVVDTIPTDTHCSPIYHFEDRPSQPLSIVPKPNARYYIDLHGPEEWIKQRRPLYAGWAKVSTFPVRNKVVKIKESEGLNIALKNWSDQFFAQTNPTTEIHSRLQKLLGQL